MFCYCQKIFTWVTHALCAYFVWLYRPITASLCEIAIFTLQTVLPSNSAHDAHAWTPVDRPMGTSHMSCSVFVPQDPWGFAPQLHWRTFVSQIPDETLPKCWMYPPLLLFYVYFVLLYKLMFTSPAESVAKYCVCVSVYLSANISPEPHARSLPNFCACCLWPSSSGVVAIHYVLPVCSSRAKSDIYDCLVLCCVLLLHRDMGGAIIEELPATLHLSCVRG